MYQKELTIEAVRQAVLNPAVVSVSVDAVRTLLASHDSTMHERNHLLALLDSDGESGFPKWESRSRENIDDILRAYVRRQP